ncbi:MAG: penicillin-binding protein 2 [Betaproteobacteria bacterium]|nr:penicillin-binding protein 2 [Betaproteobacteria bacterium]
MNAKVELRNHQRDLESFQSRLMIAIALVMLGFFGLIVRFVYLQIIQHDYYHTLAENNRITMAPVIPNRGLILDRNGAVLAHNYAGYTLEVTPSRVENLEKLYAELGQVIEITPRDRKRFRKLADESHEFASLPLRTRLNDEEVARFAVNRYRFPGVEIKARLFRHYPNGEVASHVVGYIGRITKGDKARLENEGVTENYAGSEFIGKTGLEGRYERELHGTTGTEQVETDAGGRAVRTLSHTLPVSGNNLLLNLDARLQQVAERAFGEKRGALVAIEPATGGVLALVSRPGFDPNLFVEGIDPQNWETLHKSLYHPLNNRALQGVYPPGSTFKPFMALAGLELGKRTASYAINDPGFFVLGGAGHVFRDWKKGGHGVVNMHKSLVISCDIYYYQLAQDLGIDNIFDYIGQFGFGKRTGLDIDGESGGLLPSQAWKQRRFKQKWFGGDTISVGIGQGYNLATPLQLAQATAILANHGAIFRPHLVKHAQNSRTNELRSIEAQPIGRLTIKEENFALVRDAMVAANKPGGTAAVAGMNAPYLYAGKTGTAQVIGMKKNEKYDETKIEERYRDHALYVGFAPAENPTIALAVLVENGGHGGSAAAPIARKVFDFHVLGKEPDPPKEETPAVEEEHD